MTAKYRHATEGDLSEARRRKLAARRDQLFGRDPEVVNDPPVGRHNRLEGIVFVLGGLTIAVLSVLYQL